MARVRSVDFLPEIFQTETNRQVLSATLDQLIQEPSFQKTQGYVGRKVGPGVNPQDRYVIEPTKSRADYQLEPGVVSLKPDSTVIDDVITYPGINDALKLQGAYTNNAQRLYTSDYYTWDPFIDLDKFVNFNEYYWLPSGPLSVTVSATEAPSQDNYTVTRNSATNSYNMTASSGVDTPGGNPTLTLVRGGQYTFDVAQNAKQTVNYRVGNDNIDAYVIDQQNNPTLTLVRGNTYNFILVTNGIFPFYIKTQPDLGTTPAYNSGVLNNGAVAGTITFTVPQDAPNTLYYCCSDQINMRGVFNIIDGTPGTGPGFWIQADPGVNGELIATPNISSRDVLGVTDNGIDLGTVTFDVPLSTAQNFYYGLTYVGTVDLVTDLLFNQINNQPVSTFISTYGGIDGITNLNGRTLIFSTQSSQGWELTTDSDMDGGFGGEFDASTPITDPMTQYSVWRINYVNVGGTEFLQLTNVQQIDPLEKVSILFGTQWSSTQWYKNADGYFEQIPLLTAVLDTLYYQDASNPEMFGIIRLLDPDNAATLYIDTIIDQPTYVSPNGVTFTNGLKVEFQGSVVPETYKNKQYYVEGVGTAIKLLPITDYVTPETYTKSAASPFDPLYDDTFPDGNNPSLNGKFGSFDTTNFDATLNAPLEPDYLTINRASPDLNAWSRSNRWFHIEVINASAAYNNTTPVIDNTFKARRPIIEFRSGTKLFNFGTQGKQPVDIIDFAETDALSNINGTIGYSVDGYAFVNGSRVIFAADIDPQVRNKIYEVEFITPDPDGSSLVEQPIINLVPASDDVTLADQTVVCLSGTTLQGESFWFDGVEWINAQQKIKVNQAPLFDVYDSDGISLSYRPKYPSTSFAGSKLFSYATGLGANDSVLGFALKYLSLANVGDIVFDNNLYKDTFTYVENAVGITAPISSGFVRQYSNRINFIKEIGWQRAVTKSLIRQQFQFTYDGSPLLLDVKVVEGGSVPPVQLFVDSVFQHPSNYRVTTTDTTTTITLLTTYVPGNVVEVLVLSDQISQTGFYQVPINLENNALNGNSETFTLGTVRTHYGTIAENLIDLQGPINGANNTRDLGNIIPYGLLILQQSSPLTLAGYFMRNLDYDVFFALDYNNREYIKYKSQILETVIRNEYNNQSVAQILDSAIAEITTGRTDINPFYWSDMLPTGSVYTETVNVITPITQPTFTTTQTYDFSTSNYLGLLVYLTRTIDNQPVTTLLERDIEYTVAIDGPRVTIDITLQVNDIITIREYSNTAGSFCPNTPSKMGLYPKYTPRMFLDTNYVNPTMVIQGHDGSITVAFGDIRDEILLEFEKRIYDNIKTDGNPIPLTADEIIPGFFRTTDYTSAEITNILSESFLSWVGWNKLNYKAQDYQANNAFTYNYSTAGNKINGAPLLGAWRGIYRYFYDTTSPNTTPWEMLGFSEEPDWWENIYGPAPYTSDNLVLWDDLAAGLVADPAGNYIKPEYIRSGLTQVIPNSDEGQLLAPINSVVGQYDPNSFRKSWAVGDGGPVEASWWSSSSYPFAVMRLLALTRPAEFFSLFADRDLYKFDADLGQYLYNSRYRLDANGIQIYGDGTSKASYINWIVDYNRQLGRNSTTDLTQDLANLEIRLCYRMASFTDKQYLKIYTERTGPASQNSSLLLPDESYNLLLYKNQPFNEIVYSGLIIERTVDGYSVFGYDNISPYFNILTSASNGSQITVSAGGASVRVPAQTTNIITQVPYGYNFTNTTVVVDFILSYGRYLESQGIIFDTRENGYLVNWNQMAQEFLYFSQQGWGAGTVINLNPAATTLQAYREGAIVDTIISVTPENMLLDQNRQVLPTRDLVINREGNYFTITSPSEQTISFLRLRFTNYESMVVLDNTSIFADLIYDPVTAARQNRIRIVAATSTDWNGQLDAQGFILNQDNINEWRSNKKYTKGEIVLYKNTYWSAQTIVQPKLEFDYNDWVKSDYTAIQKGLLPNIANKADQLANTYNTQVANLERDNDLLSYGLIGFRPREYMTALNLDDTSQVNIYQQFLRNKGTVRSAELFTRADLGKESGEYSIFENWGVLVSTYGANANRSFFELRLNEALLESNPSTVQVILPGQTSQADQSIFVEDIWRESYKITSPDILPTVYSTTTDTSLPSAGYVNLDDVDITVFSLDDPSSIARQIDIVGIGTTIWVAKSNSYDWNVYRCAGVNGRITQLQDNLNGTSVATFTQEHGLSVGDLIIIRYFNESVNGVYRVLSVPGIYSINIAYSFVNTNQTTLTGNGLGFYLQSMRVAQSSDVASLPYANQLIFGAKAWVDNNGSGHWEVLEKQEVFDSFDQLQPDPLVVNGRFGSSISQSTDHFSAIIGSPSYTLANDVYSATLTSGEYTMVVNSSAGLAIGQQIIKRSGTGDTGINATIVDINSNTITLDKANLSTGSIVFYVNAQGAVYTFRRGESNNYVKNITLTLSAKDTIGYGYSLDFGNQQWSVVGAPDSLDESGYVTPLYIVPGTANYVQTQLLNPPDQNFGPIRFGEAVTMSRDERWMYIGAPVANKVYAYGLVEVETQQIKYITDGITQVFNYSDFINIDYLFPDQLTVLLGSTIAREGVDYLVNATSVVFLNTPGQGQIVTITRRIAIQLDQKSSYDVAPTGGSGTGAKFTVDNIRGNYNVTISAPGTGYVVGDVLTVSATDIATPDTPPGVLIPITATYVSTSTTTLVVDDTTGIVAGMVVDGTGFVNGQYVQEVVDGTTLALNAAADSTPSGVLTFSHDLKIVVSEVVSGGITLFEPGITNRASAPYGGVGTNTDFDLTPYLYTISDIYSFTVSVNGQLQRPHIDYEFNSDSALDADVLIFLTVPPPGAAIAVTAGSYWKFVDAITVPGLEDYARFGYSLSTTTDGRQVIIGTPNDDVDALNKAGSVYVFDRSTVRYQVTDSTQSTYNIPGDFVEPVAVTLNGTYLTNTNDFINGQFTISGSDVVLSNSVTLNIGDLIEIETNQFQQVQKIASTTAFEESDFGYAVDVCPTNCSVYIGAPLDGSVLPEAGSVERRVNQSRVYGVISSTIANPTLVAGDTLRINNYEVTVPASPNNNVSGLVNAINNANLPNVVAASTANLTYISDGVTKIYNIGDLYSSTQSYTPVVYVNDILQTLTVNYNYDNTAQEIRFIVAPAEGAEIVVVSGRITISVKNSTAATAFNKLSILPGVESSVPSVLPTVFYDLGFNYNTYAFTQKIVSPNPSDFANFGKAVHIDTTALTLVVGAPNGDVYEPTTFDGGQTIFDDRSTTFFSPVNNSGVVYTFDYLPSAGDTVTDPGQFVFGQQIYDSNIRPGDQYGTAVNYSSGRLLVGAPGNDDEDSAVNYGRVDIFDNNTGSPAWAIIHEQKPVANVDLINSVFMYDKLTSSTQTYFDFFDPLQGKILGAARRNIDYLGAVDPANYNTGPIHNLGSSWANEHVGEIWWDTNTVRFIDPNQDDIVYASRRWGQVFPGSRVDIYQWISSSVPPASYTGPGVPLSTLSYTVSSSLNQDNIFETRYYFWVRGLTTIDIRAGKTLSTTAISRYIENPKNSGIPYIAALNSSTVAIYNALGLISAQDTILHIEFDKIANDANVHTEYELIADGRPDSFLSATLYRKLQDSFCGVNTSGALVPDPLLSPAERYGVQFRPRQSMFANRYLALENYLGRANYVLKQYPIVETKNLSLLNSAEPFPPTTIDSEVIWNKFVENLEELSYQNLDIVPLGYKYLVGSDSSQNGLWTIYEVVSGILIGSKALTLVRVQNYDTRRYWIHINWYRPGYNSTIQPIAEVSNYSGLDTLTVAEAPIGSSVKVTANAQGKFEIYLRTGTGWERVGLEDGTIEFKQELWNYALGNFGFDVEVFDAQYFDQEPVIETRRIIQAINEQLFIDDLLIERNRALMLMFNFIYSEFGAPEWLIKTSLIDVDHKIRGLLPFQNYLQDNQTFVLDYIQEVKPYHVQIREFNLTYNGNDVYRGMLTDFDLPAYWNTQLELPQFTSPILTPYTLSNSTVQSLISDAASTAEIWTQHPWSEWYNNYLLSVDQVNIINAGTGYTSAPTVVVTGECTEVAELESVIDSAGKIVRINVINPGLGYVTTPTLSFTGGGGAGARAYPVMTNGLVRSFKTVIKYDRYQYQSTIVEWEPNVNYDNGTLVRYLDRVWAANSDDSSGVIGPTFNFTQFTEVDSATLSGADRTMGYYVPTVNQPGLSLPLLIDGITYPGVQVYGPDFNQNTGYDIGNYDINPFDNISYGPDGRPTYDPAILDAIYESNYLDLYLGTRPTDVNVDGGAYVDPYESHAPEELVPGIEFDTLDLRVYTRPGSDWSLDGHGFPESHEMFDYTATEDTFDFSALEPYPAQILLTNLTQGTQLNLNSDYTVDWVARTVTIIGGCNFGDSIALHVYEIGGGSQLFKEFYPGTIGNKLTIPVAYSEIQNLAIFVDGTPITTFTYEALGPATKVTFDTTYSSTNGITIYAIGPTTVDSAIINYNWSIPVVQYFTADGSLSYNLDNSLEYSNPDNLIVSIDGIRARTSAGVEYYGNNVETTFLLPDRLGFSQALIANNEVRVYINDVPQILNIAYSVEPWTGNPRNVIFNSAPATGARILICVNTNTECRVNGNQLLFASGSEPSAGQIVSVTTWNDTRQQNILTQVFVGPDSGNNNFIINHGYEDPYRLWVTLNGERLWYGINFIMDGNEIVLGSGTISASDVFMVTQFTDSMVPEAIAFRIFQDMRGVQATYRITTSTTTYLTQTLNAGADIIYVNNASALSQPGLASNYNNNIMYNAGDIVMYNGGFYQAKQTTTGNLPTNTTYWDLTSGSANVWGVITINGERIMYRYRDTVNNTVSGLLRGTAGTGAAKHGVNSLVYDMGRDNLLPAEYQDYVTSETFVGDDATVSYTTDIVIDNRPLVYVGGSIEVYIDSVLQASNTYTVAALEPVVIEFDEIPEAGKEVLIVVINPSGTDSQLSTATGSSARFVTTLDVELIEQPSSSYVLDDFEPVIITFNTPVDAGKVVFITNQRGAEDEFDFSISNGVNPTFTTDINLTIPVRVYVGGTEVVPSSYQVTSLDPVIVVFDEAPASGVEVTILIRRGTTWYQQGINTASNGVALQETNTLAARFFRGEI